jgi:hypothetical protein
MGGTVKSQVAVALFASIMGGCNPSPTPTPVDASIDSSVEDSSMDAIETAPVYGDAPPSPDGADAESAQFFLTELVEGGCLDPNDPTNLTTVEEAMVSDAIPPEWACLFAGGTVESCMVCPQGDL